MNSPTWFQTRRSAIASLLVIAMVVSIVAGFAWRSDGYTSADVELNDSGVWVSDSTRSLVGHFNDSAGELDGSVRLEPGEMDIVQDGDVAFAVSSGSAEMLPLDGATMALGTGVALDPGTSVALGGGVLAAIEESTGALRIASEEEPAGVGSATDPVAELGASSVISVGADGAVHAYSAESGELITYRADDGGTFSEVNRVPVPGSPAPGTVQIGAVGAVALVLDRSAGRLISTDGLDIAVPDPSNSALQLPSSAADSVVLAAGGQVVTQPLRGGTPHAIDVVGSTGRAARPAVVDGCVHAAWSAGAYVRDCGGTVDELSAGTVDGKRKPFGAPVFRVNRSAVVLDDEAGTDLWVADQNLKLVDNWTDVIPPDMDTDQRDEQSLRKDQERATADRQDGNRPPTAADDDFGVRPGRSTLLPVLDNDSDPDGDVLTVVPVGGQPAGSAVAPARDGTALQITVAPDAIGRQSFRYEVSDGLGGTDQASVSVDVRPMSVNEPPRPQRVPELVVAQSRSIAYNALNDWIDPDGDAVVAVSAQPTSPGDSAQVLPNGRFTFADGGQVLGARQVPITVSDGRASAEGTIRVVVEPIEKVLPVANADHVLVQQGRPTSFSPLANDVDPAGGQLRLAKIGEVPDAVLAPDYAAGAVQITAHRPGTYYVSYTITNGPGTAEGLIRIDVAEPTGGGRPPVTADDVALLPAGGDVLVDVLSNDTDPDGGVLVVQSVEVPTNSGITVAALQHRVLRISNSNGISTPVTVRYTVSNGSASARGSVDVVPLPPPAKLSPPSAEPDEAVVRVGDIVTIAVMDNDSHPDGDVIRVVPDLVQGVDPADGNLFVSQNALRLKAGDRPGTLHAIYSVVDTAGQTDSAQVSIRVVPRNDEANTAPKPVPVAGRVISGATARIPIPLAGIDADGDSVSLVGIGAAPGRGRVGEVGDGWIDYTALEGATGADFFEYTVADTLGRRATGRVDVGIAPSSPQNQPPTAVDDRVTVRPGRDVSIPVLDNDIDPDGDLISLNPDAFGSEQDRDTLGALADGDLVTVAAPRDAGTFTFGYGIDDARGASARAMVMVTVDPDAPLLRPLARDDRVDATKLVDSDGAPRSQVEVDVLVNDSDPDGTLGALTVTSSDAGAMVEPNGRLSIALTDAAQIVTYSITDADGGQASAFVLVPGRTGVAPALRDRSVVEVTAGQDREFDLVDAVVVRAGRTARLTDDRTVKALHGDGSQLVVDATRLRYTAAPDYTGDDALTFEVTDGTGPDDPEGLTATLTIPIRVLPDGNQPPTLRGTTVEVAPGDPVTVDLRKLATDPNAGDLDKLTFTATSGTSAGVTSALDGSQLTLTASDSAAPGASVPVEVSVTDGASEPVIGTVLAQITASNRPLPIANNDDFGNAVAGQSISVSVLANDYNPFPDTPLRILSAEVQSGPASATIAGDQVQLTVPAEFVGTVSARYRIADATGDPSRESSALVSATVRGKPDAPAAPTVEEVRNATVVLSWSPPSNNGAPITGYRVQSDNGVQQDCPSTTCTIAGLRNGDEYRFTVVAVNEVGDSLPSAVSGVARPDAKPDTPEAPTVVAGDRSLQVTWAPPNNEGSQIADYTVEISPSTAGGSQRTGITGTSLTVSDAQNGVPYQVRVQARNSAPDPSEWSAFSASVTPAGLPQTPSAPTAQRAASSVNGGVIDVEWAEPDDNGAEISKYDLQVRKDGSVVDTKGGLTGTSVQVTGLSTAAAYSFSVIAYNKVGPSVAGPASAAVTPYGLPAAVSSVTATAADGAATLAFTAPADNGSAITGWQVSVNGSGYQSWSAGPGGSYTGLTNGTSYTFSVRAENAAGTGPDGSASASITPFGAPKAPAISGAAAGKAVTFTWNSDQSSLTNGRPIASVDVTFDGQAVANNGSVTMGDGWSQNHTLRIKVCASEGGCTESTGTATSAAEPKPTSWQINIDATSGTCPEPDTSAPFNHQNGACGSPGYQKTGTMTVTCWTGPFGGIDQWYRSSGGAVSGFYIAVAHTNATSVPAGMPRC